MKLIEINGADKPADVLFQVLRDYADKRYLIFLSENVFQKLKECKCIEERGVCNGDRPSDTIYRLCEKHDFVGEAKFAFGAGLVIMTALYETKFEYNRDKDGRLKSGETESIIYIK